MDITEARCMRNAIRLCHDGWMRGWHECNGGNLSYRLSPEDVEACSPFFGEAGPWEKLPRAFPDLAGEFLIMTGTGQHMRNVDQDPSRALGILEISDEGDVWRCVWGLVGGRPSSELLAHLGAHAVRARVTEGRDRTIYHAHPQDLIALSCVIPQDPVEVTHALWTSFTEAIIAFPGGVGVVPWLVPGSPELAQRSTDLMERRAALLWVGHGVFCSGPSPDDVFGLVETMEKAAHIYLEMAKVKGLGKVEPVITDTDLRAIAERYDLAIDESCLEADSLLD